MNIKSRLFRTTIVLLLMLVLAPIPVGSINGMVAQFVMLVIFVSVIVVTLFLRVKLLVRGGDNKKKYKKTEIANHVSFEQLVLLIVGGLVLMPVFGGTIIIFLGDVFSGYKGEYADPIQEFFNLIGITIIISGLAFGLMLVLYKTIKVIIKEKLLWRDVVQLFIIMLVVVFCGAIAIQT